MKFKNSKPKSFRSELQAYAKAVAKEIRKDGFAVKRLTVCPTVCESFQNTPTCQIWDIYFQTEHPGTEVIMGALLPAHIPHCTQEEFCNSWVTWDSPNPAAPCYIDGKETTYNRIGVVTGWVCEIKTPPTHTTKKLSK